MNVFPHASHVCGLFFVWIRWCLVRFSLKLKVDSHISHLNGFSPVWTTWCSCNLTGRQKVLSHWEHGCGRSVRSVCTDLICVFRFWDILFPHVVQLYGFHLCELAGVRQACTLMRNLVHKWGKWTVSPLHEQTHVISDLSYYWISFRKLCNWKVSLLSEFACVESAYSSDGRFSHKCHT